MAPSSGRGPSHPLNRKFPKLWIRSSKKSAPRPMPRSSAQLHQHSDLLRELLTISAHSSSLSAPSGPAPCVSRPAATITTSWVNVPTFQLMIAHFSLKHASQAPCTKMLDRRLRFIPSAPGRGHNDPTLPLSQDRFHAVWAQNNPHILTPSIVSTRSSFL